MWHHMQRMNRRVPPILTYYGLFLLERGVIAVDRRR